MRNLNNWQDAENISLELGFRAYSGLCAESEGTIEGVSIIGFAELLQAEYDAGDPMGADQALRSLPWGSHWSDDTLPDFRLIDGLRILYHLVMVEGDFSPWVLARWFPEYEEELLSYEEALARDGWETWVAEGGMDDEPLD